MIAPGRPLSQRARTAVAPRPSLALTGSFTRVVPLALAAMLAVGCASRRPPRTNPLPPPRPSYVFGPGDKFEMMIVGEEKLPKEYTVAPDGSVEFPFVHSQHVAGLEPQQIAALVHDELVKQRFLENPSVVINIKEFSSKTILVGGQVNHPGEVPFLANPSLNTLRRVIEKAGGFASAANRNTVRVTRKLPDGRTKTAVFSVDDISEGRTADVPLQDGDSVYVDERSF